MVGFTGGLFWTGFGFRMFLFGFKLIAVGSKPVQIGSWGRKRSQEKQSDPASIQKPN